MLITATMNSPPGQRGFRDVGMDGGLGTGVDCSLTEDALECSGDGRWTRKESVEREGFVGGGQAREAPASLCTNFLPSCSRKVTRIF